MTVLKIMDSAVIGYKNINPSLGFCIVYINTKKKEDIIMSPNSCPGGTFPYAIMVGDTCHAIAQRFGTTVVALKAANPGLDCNNLRVGQTICVFIEPSTVNCPPGTQRYTIQAGDTYWSLARRFNTTVQAIQVTNPGVDPNNLFIGQKICVPAITPMCPGGLIYTIKPGDTFWALAKAHKMDVYAIIKANPNIDPNNLRIGQKICIPGAAYPGP